MSFIIIQKKKDKINPSINFAQPGCLWAGVDPEWLFARFQ